MFPGAGPVSLLHWDIRGACSHLSLCPASLPRPSSMRGRTKTRRCAACCSLTRSCAGEKGWLTCTLTLSRDFVQDPYQALPPATATIALLAAPRESLGGAAGRGGDEERGRPLGTVLAEERVLEAPLTWPVYVASLSVFVREASSHCWEA